MHHIDSKNLIWVGGHKWTADASEIGLPPGVWPDTLTTNMGNGLPMIADSDIMHAGEFQGRCYRQPMHRDYIGQPWSGIKVYVFND
jgi:hypothetical protein